MKGPQRRHSTEITFLTLILRRRFSRRKKVMGSERVLFPNASRYSRAGRRLDKRSSYRSGCFYAKSLCAISMIIVDSMLLEKQSWIPSYQWQRAEMNPWK
ncbi:hypothetical protein BYT27DRAFT_6826347 [Phlegmacium glaucopus]|nr:hypothetical protein BYT27DRAFT_6826347 [Phlegmacium glaucopus]